ncbi:hypothetical protein ACQ4PT_070805 [Festuca glaucescens]
MARSAGGPLNQPLRQPILSRTTPGRHGGSVGKVDDGLKDGAAVGTGTAGNPEVQPTTNLPVSRFDAGSSSNQGGRMEGWHTNGFRGQGFGNFEEGFFEGNNGYGNGYGAMSRGNFRPRPYRQQFYPSNRGRNNNYRGGYNRFNNGANRYQRNFVNQESSRETPTAHTSDQQVLPVTRETTNAGGATSVEENVSTVLSNRAQKKVEKMLCLRCGENGHLADNCPAVLCLYCEKTSHESKNCPLLSMPKPVAVTYGVSRNELMFHEIPASSDVTFKHDSGKVGKISVEGGSLAAQEIVNELTWIIPGNHQWDLQLMEDGAYKVLFPSKADLARMTKIIRVPVPGTDMFLVFEEWSAADLDPFSLTEVWVKVHGCCYKERCDYLSLFAVGSLIGKTKEVDMKFTRSHSEVRMKVEVTRAEFIPTTTVDHTYDGAGYGLLFKPEDGQIKIKSDVVMQEANMDDDANGKEDKEEDSVKDANLAPLGGPVDRFPVEMQYGQIPPPMLDGTPAELESLSSPSIVKNNDAAAGMEDVEHDVKGLHPKAGESMELPSCTSKGQSTFRTENTSSKQVPQGNINRCGTGVFLGGRLSNDEVVDFGGISPPVKGARSSGRIRLQENADDTQMEQAQKLAKAKDVASSSCIPRSKGNKPHTLQEKQLLSAKDKGPVSDGHTTGMCPAANKPTELKWYGFAIEGGAFYAFDCPPLEINPKHDNMAYVLADASEEVINEGLKKLIDESWDFQVRKVADSEFAVQFPNADSLRLCKNATNLSLPMSKVTVVITEIRPPCKASGKLQEVWVRLHDVPPQLLTPEHLLAAMVLLGKPLVVDELSLSKDEPVLMKFQTPVLAKLRTTVSLTVHGEIFPIRVVPALGKGAASAADPPPPPPGDADDQDDEEEEETEDHSASDHNWKRQKAKSRDKPGGPSSNATSAGTKTVGHPSLVLAAMRPKPKKCKKVGHKPSSANKKKCSPCSPPLETQLENSFD